MPKTFTGSTAGDQALAGFSAGAVSTVLLHPLDLVKTRFQSGSTAGAFPLTKTSP